MHLTRILQLGSEATHDSAISGARSSAEETVQQPNLFGSGARVRMPQQQDLLEYERIAPGTSEMIVQFMEHRRANHEEFILRESRRERRTLHAMVAYAFMLIALSLLASWYCLREGAPVAGAIMGATALALLTCLALFSRDEKAR